MTDKAPRITKTAATRAQEQVAILNRRLGKIKAHKALLEKQAKDLAPLIEAVQAHLTYALANPDMPPPSRDSTKEEPPTLGAGATP